MKKYIYYLRVFSAIILLMLLTGCDEDGKIDADDIRASVLVPEITSFQPTSGVAGTEVIITGNNLSSVDLVYLGEESVKIKNRISNDKLLIEITANAKSGKIRVKNPKGENESQSTFNIITTVPDITEILTAVEGEIIVGEVATIRGENLKAAAKVLIAGVEAKIEFISDNELRFVVPYISASTTSKIVIEYLDGENTKTVESAGNYHVKTSTIIPSITDAPKTAIIGTTITITGVNLDIASSAILGEEKINFISRTATEVKFAIPTNFFVETTADLIFVYNETEQMVAVKDFVVTVPPVSDKVLFYPALILGAEKDAMSRFFFNPENGSIYTACDYQNIKSKIYLFVSSYTSGNTVQFNNPNNSADQPARFECNGIPLDKGVMPNVIKYKVLKATTSSEKLFIDHVKNRTLGEISPEIVKQAGVSNANTQTPRYGTNFNVGDVIMFQKFDATGVTVEKVGFMDITEVNLNAENLGESTIKINCFFQK